MHCGHRSAIAHVFVLVVAVPPRARALGEDQACVVTNDCDAPLRCAGGRCVSLEPKPEWQPLTSGDRAMFGDGRGYMAAMIGTDILALVGTTSLFLAAHGTDAQYRGGWQGAAMVPLVLGPVVHATRGRWLAATISFLGWSSLGVTLLSASLLSSSCAECSTPFLAIGAGVLAVGGALLPTLDAWMARDVRTERRRASWWPVLAPTRTGAFVGFGGRFM